jgi:hypothetical protein
MKKLVLVFIAFMAMTSSMSAQSYNNFNSSVYGNNRSSRRSSSSVYGYGSTNSNVRYQSGYTRNDGTFVTPHYQTMPNNTNHDNFSTRDNSNPFTGTTGTRARDYSSDAYNYGAGQQILTGSRGGQYYVNGNGNKTYVPKRSSSSSLW